MPLLRIVQAIVALAFRAALFGRPHRRLPALVRPSGAVFLSLLAAFYVAAVLRHQAVAGVSIGAHAVGLGFYTALLLLAAQRYAAEVALFLAASTGVDLVFALAGALGAGIASAAAGWLGLGWELLATAVAIVQLHAERRATK